MKIYVQTYLSDSDMNIFLFFHETRNFTKKLGMNISRFQKFSWFFAKIAKKQEKSSNIPKYCHIHTSICRQLHHLRKNFFFSQSICFFWVGWCIFRKHQNIIQATKHFLVSDRWSANQYNIFDNYFVKKAPWF